jgi:hexosaminidase
LLGWDEILEGGLAPNATVMAWRGEKGGIDAAKSGHDVVMAPNHYVYFDYYQTEEQSDAEIRIGGYLPIDRVYGYEPIPAGLTPEQAAHVLGAQGQIWTEYMPGPKDVEWMAFPRVAALAEVLWLDPAKKEYADFSERLAQTLARLDVLDVKYYRP